MLKTVRCFLSPINWDRRPERELRWEEEVTYDDRYWEYISNEGLGLIRYKRDGYSKVPEKPMGMTHCYKTFEGYRGAKLDLASFDTSDVIDMSYMFSECSNLQFIDLSSFDTFSVTDMKEMFSECSRLQRLDLSSFDTSKVTSMMGMFKNCNRLQSLDISSFDTSNVTNMIDMFTGCIRLQFLDLSHFNTVHAYGDFQYMFKRTPLDKYNTHFGSFNKKPKKPIRKPIKKFKGSDSLYDISKEIDKLLHDGNISSPKSLIDSLRGSGFSDAGIVDGIIYKIDSGSLDRDTYSPIVNSYIEETIQLKIVRNLSSKSVGEVLDILYSNYPENIVNKAMCSYLRPQYLVD